MLNPRRTATPWLDHDTSLQSITSLTVEVIRGHLTSRGLTTTGNKKALAQRLLDHLQSQRTGSSPSSSSPSSHSDRPARSPSRSSGSLSPAPRRRAGRTTRTSSTVREDHRSRTRRRRHTGDRGTESDCSASDRRAHRYRGSGAHQSFERRRKRSHSSRHQRDRERSRSRRPHYRSRHHRERGQATSRHRRAHRHSHSRHRSPSVDSHRTRRSPTSASSDSLGAHRPNRKRRSHEFSDSSDSERSSSDTEALPDPPFRTPPARRIRKRIAKGKYVSFARLLERNRFTTPHSGKLPSGPRSRQVHDLASWLEAWNLYLPLRLAHDPSMALELVKYQSIICSLFATLDASTVVGYDRLFRHRAARDSFVRWDVLKEDLFVFQASTTGTIGQKTGTPFRKPIFNRLGPPTDPKSNYETIAPSGVEICRRFNSSKCSFGENCRFSHICSHKGCGGAHPAKGCSHKHPSQ